MNARPQLQWTMSSLKYPSATDGGMANKEPLPVEHVEDDKNFNHTRPSPNQNVTRLMLLFSLFIALSAWIANFDLGYGGIVLLMPSFNRAFGPCQMVPDPITGESVELCQVTATQQSLISLTQLFGALGGILSGISSTYLGRRGTVQLSALIVLISASGMLGTSGSFLNYMVCKCIGGVGLGLLYVTAMVYGVECTAPQKRGMLLSLYTIGLAFGNAGAAAVCAGSSNIVSDWAWKTPIACQIPLSIILGGGVMLFPESPRWLLLKGNEDKARKSFGRFYKKDPNSDDITAQVKEVQTYLNFEKATSSTTSWTEIFHKKNLRRTLLSVFIMVATNITGLQFVAPYTAIFLGGLGIKSPFLINAIIALCFSTGSLIGGVVVEYGGRRFAMLAGYSIMACYMLIFSAVSTGLGASSQIARNVLVTFLCLWAFTFSGFIAPSGWVASTEMHSTRLRAYGQACSINFSQIFGFGAAFWTPYMISKQYGNMGTDVGYFYFGLTVVSLVVVFFYVPETARLKLEQIDDHFESGRPAWKTSIGRNKAIAKNNVLEVSSDGLPA